MRSIEFYKTSSGHCPVEEFMDLLTDQQVEKIFWVLKLIKEIDRVPACYFKKLVNTDGIYEVRVSFGGNIFRLLCFFHDRNLVVLTNGFQKKTQACPEDEIELAENRKKDFLRRHKNGSSR
jgi:phage-related protein